MLQNCIITIRVVILYNFNSVTERWYSAHGCERRGDGQWPTWPFKLLKGSTNKQLKLKTTDVHVILVLAGMNDESYIYFQYSFFYLRPIRESKHRQPNGKKGGFAAKSGPTPKQKAKKSHANCVGSFPPVKLYIIKDKL